MDTDREVGDLGEDIFVPMCTSVGITTNKSLRDKHGWDFVVEYVQPRNPKVPLDQQDFRIDCRFQIKSTDGSTGSCRVTLNNLSKMCLSSLPSFFCVFEFDGESQPKRAYLKHVDEQLIEKVLKRLREIEVSSEAIQLNKTKMSVSYLDGEELVPINGESLRRSIENAIPEGMKRYSERKIKTLENIGFDGIQGSFTTSGKNIVREMNDVAFGFQQSIPVKNFKLFNQRFGIQLNKPEVSLDEGLLKFSISENGQHCKILFRETKHSAPLCFDAEFVQSPFNHTVADDEKESLFKSALFTVRLTGFKNDSRFQFEYDPDRKNSLKKLNEFYRLLDLFSRRSQVLLSIDMGKKEIHHTTVQVSDIDDNYSKIYKLTKQLSEVVSDFELDPDELNLSVRDIARYAGYTNIHHGLLRADLSDDFFIQSHLASETANDEGVIENVAILTYGSTRASDLSLISLVSLKGDFIRTDNDVFKLHNGKRELRRNLVSDADNEITNEEMQVLAKEYQDELENSGYIVYQIAFSPQRNEKNELTRE